MSVRDETIAKIHQLPETLVQQVNDFVDFLMKDDRYEVNLWSQFTEGRDLAELNFSDYLQNLEAYEERLARGEIQW
ncbi:MULTISPECIES: hypothetical protein [Kamptonema]|uniref:hypothetical protein n=1 Tax=Kamptonema TaxID=1501433 RepID=UPI0001DAC71C|nr:MULTISPECIES: hypothetical protein [Kamptonema]CBN57391.1 conserved hypothetical protein [Kamptonema sp. PCC 6506]